MANSADDWLYNDDLDVSLPGRGRLDTDTQEGDDLLDDMLTAPSSSSALRTETPTNDDELLGRISRESDTIIEDSASARYNADRKARTVQARIEANLTSQGVMATPGASGLAIFSREPNRKNSVYIGNMNWWTTDLHVLAVVKEHGLGEVTCLKFFENRANGQSKGYCLVELATESLAISAPDKLANVEIHDRKLIVVYALRISPHQFESKCNIAKEQGTTPVFSTGNTSSSTGLISSTATNNTLSSKNSVTKTSLPGAVPPLPNPIFSQPPRPTLPGFPTPPLPGLRPPGLPDLASIGLPGLVPPPFPPFPGARGLNPFVSRSAGGLPTLPPIPPAAALAALGSAAAGAGGIATAGAGGDTKLSAPHLNPAFLQEMTQSGANMAEILASAAARFRQQTGGGSPSDRGKPLANHHSDEEISETNQRNKAISSSAITRAMSDAQTGDYEGAIDTLRMAITLIKQSITASSEASQIMIQSLQDCLQGMEQQASAAAMASKRYRSSGGGGGGMGGGSGGSSRHIHEMRERDIREREPRDLRDFRDMRDFRGDERLAIRSHKMSKHRDRSRERRR